MAASFAMTESRISARVLRFVALVSRLYTRPASCSTCASTRADTPSRARYSSYVTLVPSSAMRRRPCGSAANPSFSASVMSAMSLSSSCENMYVCIAARWWAIIFSAWGWNRWSATSWAASVSTARTPPDPSRFVVAISRRVASYTCPYPFCRESRKYWLTPRSAAANAAGLADRNEKSPVVSVPPRRSACSTTQWLALRNQLLDSSLARWRALYWSCPALAANSRVLRYPASADVACCAVTRATLWLNSASGSVRSSSL